MMSYPLLSRRFDILGFVFDYGSARQSPFLRSLWWSMSHKVESE